MFSPAHIYNSCIGQIYAYRTFEFTITICTYDHAKNWLKQQLTHHFQLVEDIFDIED